MALLYKKTFDDDIFFFLPMSVLDQKRFTGALKQLEQAEAGKSGAESGYGEDYCRILSGHIEYECENPTFRSLERHYLGVFKLACYDDNYEGIPLDTEDAHLFITFHRSTGLCMVTMAIPDNHYIPTQLIDQMSSNNLDVLPPEGTEYLPVEEYMADRFGLEVCGESKCVICMSKQPEDEIELAYMLAGETYVSEHIDYHLHENRIKPLLENHACYDYYESYISRSVVAFVMKDYSDDLCDRLDREASVLFVVGIVLFQNTAVLRTNNRVVAELAESDGITNQEIEKLYLEFGQTMKFWSTNIYKYPFSQMEAEEVIRSFGIDRALEDYHRNQAFLDRLIELRGTIAEERSSSSMNLILYILAWIESISIILGGVASVIDGSATLRMMLVSVGVSVVLGVVATIMYVRFVKKTRLLKKKK